MGLRAKSKNPAWLEKNYTLLADACKTITSTSEIREAMQLHAGFKTLSSNLKNSSRSIWARKKNGTSGQFLARSEESTWGAILDRGLYSWTMLVRPTKRHSQLRRFFLVFRLFQNWAKQEQLALWVPLLAIAGTIVRSLRVGSGGTLIVPIKRKAIGLLYNRKPFSSVNFSFEWKAFMKRFQKENGKFKTSWYHFFKKTKNGSMNGSLKSKL